MVGERHADKGDRTGAWQSNLVANLHAGGTRPPPLVGCREAVGAVRFEARCLTPPDQSLALSNPRQRSRRCGQ
jgi:hypothetical protein